MKLMCLGTLRVECSLEHDHTLRLVVRCMDTCGNLNIGMEEEEKRGNVG